jgi:hypothetical protein
MLDLSVIVVNYNTSTFLRNCLQSVFEQTRGLDYEVIVVDNASWDGSREMLQHEFPKVRTIFNSENKGFAAANNQAIRVAQGRYVLLLNSDTRVLDGAIQETFHFMEEHREASIVGCKLLNSDGTLQPSCMSFPTVWNLFVESSFLYLVFPRTKLFGRYHMSYFNYDTIETVDFVTGAFMMIRRAVFESVGLFDESYFMYTEETDLCYRAKQHGFNVCFIPWTTIVHYGRGSIDSTDRFLEQVHQTQLQFVRKHFRGMRKFLGIVLKEVGIAVRIPTYFLVGLFTFDSTLLRKSRSYLRVLFNILR